jgi:hypothetical protein
VVYFLVDYTSTFFMYYKSLPFVLFHPPPLDLTILIVLGEEYKV